MDYKFCSLNDGWQVYFLVLILPDDVKRVLPLFEVSLENWSSSFEQYPKTEPQNQTRLRLYFAEVGNWKLEVGNWKLEVGNWKLEIGSWKLEVGNWKLEIGSWKLEVGSWKLQIANCKLQTVNCKLQSANCKLQTAICNLQTGMELAVRIGNLYAGWYFGGQFMDIRKIQTQSV
ncbi:hypothetical protein [Methanolapillus millepedarum]|uniref:Uncharacterized protein n=1 Tax=Methanolapillus millepedarum TaxID=3028296 RepID=A0AA96ZTH0_9EURY|nr:hypothetical protein MsAc7_01120 [Methanosarcinaceae archaeon Ac7]